MNVSEYLMPIDAQFDFPELKRIGESCTDWEEYHDYKTNTWIKGWFVWRCESGYPQHVSDQVADFIGSNACSPRYYLQGENVRLPFHQDRGTQCSFNFILSDDPAPIQFKWFCATYKNALLNVQQEHAVLASRMPRLLFKVSVFDKTYQEVRDVLQSKLSPSEQRRVAALFL